MNDEDSTYMDLALRLGRRTMGDTGANPAVGCVLVRREGASTYIVGRGWTGRGGRPHAETRALAAAADAARGSVAYVTLEPCSHHGMTPPCASALIDAGVVRVVAAIEDPDPRVCGRGLQRLREAGIMVDLGVGEDAARRDLAGFLSRIERQRPFVTLKLAVSGDDKIAKRRDAPTRITGDAARSHSHLLRATSDAILVGVSTVLADDPDLTCRLPGMEDRSPCRVVLDTTLRCPATSRLCDTAAGVPVVVFCSEDADREREDVLRLHRVDVVRIATDADGYLDLGAVLAELARRGHGRLLVEGGGRVADTFMTQGLVDETVIFRNPATLGTGAVDAFQGRTVDDVLAANGFALSQTHECGEDVMLGYSKNG